MPITQINIGRSPVTFMLLGSLLLLTLAPNVLPKESAAKPSWTLTLDGAYFWPTQDAVKKVYSAARIPLTLRLSYVSDWGIGFYAGFRYLRCRGETRFVDSGFIPETYRTILTVYAPQAGIFYPARLGKITCQLAAGICYGFYSENWRNAPISFSNHQFGFQADASASYPLLSRLAVIIRIGYFGLSTRQGAALANKVNLSGLETGIGLACRF